MPPLQGDNQKQTSGEAEVISRVRDGDQAACRDLYQRHKGRIFTLASRMAGDRAWAEDLTQDIFVQAFKGLDGFRERCSFSTWLHRIAINRCRSWLRERGPASLPLEQAEAGGTGELRRAGMRLLLESSIARLPEGCREVFVLHDVQGMGHGEIAEILGCSQGNVRAQLWKARGKLREMIAPRLTNEEYELSGLEQESAEPA